MRFPSETPHACHANIEPRPETQSNYEISTIDRQNKQSKVHLLNSTYVWKLQSREKTKAIKYRLLKPFFQGTLGTPLIHFQCKESTRPILPTLGLTRRCNDKKQLHQTCKYFGLYQLITKKVLLTEAKRKKSTEPEESTVHLWPNLFERKEITAHFTYIFIHTNKFHEVKTK